MPWRRSKSDGLHITKVGLWFGIFTLVVAVGATNTGNNGLFLALAVMGGVAAVSDVAGRLNVRGLRVALSAPGEIFANCPSTLSVEVANPSRWLPRWLLVLTVRPEDVEPAAGVPAAGVPAAAGSEAFRRAQPFLAAHLPPRAEVRGQIEVMMRRRGRWRLRWVHVASLYPLGFFRRGRRYLTEVEILIYPEIYPASPSRVAQLGRAGDEPTRRRGWGHDLHGLRAYRHGDDPRNVHWKQSARTGDLIFKERQTEENRRLQIVFDNAVGELTATADHQRFERLVSEAATAALDHLDCGFEVGLLSRDVDLPFAAGRRQRRRVLEALALIEPRSEDRRPLAPAAAQRPCLRLTMEPRADGGRRPLRGVA
jgi:uncharacterized protein (DUF58 family)